MRTKVKKIGTAGSSRLKGLDKISNPQVQIYTQKMEWASHAKMS